MEVNDVVKLLLAISFSVSLVGISIQVMRILGTLNDTLQDFRYLAYKIMEMLETIGKDYGNLKKGVSGAFSNFGRLNNNFVEPLVNLATTVGTLATIFKEKITGKQR
jgi:hypothetical protein